MNRTKIIIATVTLVILICLLFIFINKSDKDEKRIKNEYDYSLKFDYYEDKVKRQSLSFNYKNKRLNNIKLTIIFPDKHSAKELYKEYKKVDEYSKAELKKNNIILTYSKDSMSLYKNLTKEEIIATQEEAGYIYVPSNK